jgi:uncharacterized protein
MRGSSQRSQARKWFCAFLLPVLVLSYSLQAWILSRTSTLTAVAKLSCTLILMWIPAAVAIALKLVAPRSFTSFELHPPRARWWLASYLIPAAAGLCSYGLGWLTGLTAPAIPWNSIASSSLPSGGLGLAAWLALHATVGVAAGCVFALGEEIGWRGFLLPLAIRAQLPGPFVLVGVIWGVWHLPLVVSGMYAGSDLPIVSVLSFLAATTLGSVIYGWLRLASRSLWPAVMIHASHNVFFLLILDPMTARSRLSPFVVGESGVIPLAVYGALVAWIAGTGRLRLATLDARRWLGVDQAGQATRLGLDPAKTGAVDDS